MHEVIQVLEKNDLEHMENVWKKNAYYSRSV